MDYVKLTWEILRDTTPPVLVTEGTGGVVATDLSISANQDSATLKVNAKDDQTGVYSIEAYLFDGETNDIRKYGDGWSSVSEATFDGLIDTSDFEAISAAPLDGIELTKTDYFPFTKLYNGAFHIFMGRTPTSQMSYLSTFKVVNTKCSSAVITSNPILRIQYHSVPATGISSSLRLTPNGK